MRLVDRRAASLAGCLGVALMIASTGCSTASDKCGARPPTVAVPTPPPAPLEEVQQAAPAPNMAWIPGEWHWDGVRYVWVPGHWATPPAGQRWIPASHSRANGGATFQAGSFGCEE